MDAVEGPPINDWLRCSICLDIYREPTSLVCSHMFCKKCIDEWVIRYRKTQCPVCNAKFHRNGLKPAPSVVREMLSSLRVKCPNHQRGCQTTFPFENSGNRQREHLKECQYQSDVCTCGQTVIRAHKISHVETECPDTVTPCPHKCGKRMSRKDLPTHNCVQEVVSAVATATEEQGKKMDFMSGSVSMMQQQLCEVRTSFATLQEQTGSSLAKKTRQIEEISRDIQALKRVSKTTLLLIQLLTLLSVLHRTQSVLSLKS